MEGCKFRPMGRKKSSGAPGMQTKLLGFESEMGAKGSRASISHWKVKTDMIFSN